MSSLFSVSNLTFGYNGSHVLKNISLEIEKGYLYGIVGPNGSGKSTFLDHLSGFIKAERGKVLFKEKKIEKYPRKAIAKMIATVYQNFYINFGYTVFEAVMMGRHPHIPKFTSPSEKDLMIVDRAIKQAGIEKYRNRLVTKLSGGERQRVVFARALAQNTEVLILDEATSNLDINHTLKLMGIVKKRVENRGTTVISVFQDLNLAAMFCEKLIFLKDGEVAAYGEIDDVLSSENIRNIFNVNAVVEKRNSFRNILFEEKI